MPETPSSEPTFTIDLDDDVVGWMDALVQSGEYASRIDVLRKALSHFGRTKLYFRLRRAVRVIVTEILTDDEMLRLSMIRAEDEFFREFVRLANLPRPPAPDDDAG